MHHARFTLLSRLAVFLVAACLLSLSHAQTTLTYTNGQTRSTSETTTAANPLTLTIATGSATQSGTISGDGSLTKTGAGTINLSGANSYTGGTQIDQGTLGITGSGSVLGSIINNANLAIAVANFANDVSGTGTVTITGANPVATGNFTHTGGTTLNGNLQIGNGGTTGSLAGNVLVNASLGFNRSDAYSFAGIISGGGSLSKSGTGTLTLSAANTYSGATTVNGGTLLLAATGSLNSATALTVNAGGTFDFSLAGNVTVSRLVGAGSVVTNGGVFNVNQSITSLFSGSITGAGQLQKSGAGQLEFSGTNTYSGGTLISAGTLLLSGSGSLTGNIVNNATLNVSRAVGSNTTFASDISGTGAVTFTQGTQVVTGNLSHTGGTTVAGGTLQVGNGGTTGTIAGNVTTTNSLTTLSFNRADAATFAGVLSGSGTLVKAGAGTLTLSGSNTYSGATTVNAGTLAVGAAGALNSVTSLAVSAGASFDFSAAGANVAVNQLTGAGTVVTNGGFLQVNSGTFSGSLTGSGGLQKVTGGTLQLTGTSTYAGATLLGGGTISFGSAASLGDGSGTNRFRFSGSGGTLQWRGGNTADVSTRKVSMEDSSVANFDTNGNNVTLANAIGYDAAGTGAGTGSLVKTGIGTLTLLGNNLYTGATTVNGGTLQIGNGGTSGSVAGDITNNSEIRFNRSDAVTYAGNISGVGDVYKRGTGTLTLTGTNAATTYDIDGGTLVLGSANALGGGDIRISNATLDAGAYGLALDRISTGVHMTLTSSGIFSYNSAANQFLSQLQLAGTGALVKDGTGTLQIDTNSTHTGGTTVNQGTLQFSVGTGSDTFAGSITNHASLVVQSGNLSGAIVSDGTMDVTGNLTGNVTNQGTVNLNGNNQGTMANAGTLNFLGGNNSGSITGAGAVSIQNHVTNTGTMAPTGGTTITSGFILTIGDGGSNGSIAGNVATEGALVFNRSGAAGLAGDISGTGIVRLDGPGTITLSGNNSHSGGALVNAGTLVQGSANALGTGGIELFGGNLDTAGYGLNLERIANNSYGTVSGSGAFQYNSAADRQIGGLTGAGSLVKDGTGVLKLAGDVALTGGVTISAGTLQIGAQISGFDTGTLSGNVVNNGTLAFNRTNVAYTGNISGSGNVVAQSDSLSLSGNNTHTGGTVIDSGTLFQGSANALGTGQVTINAGGTLDTGAYAFDLHRVATGSNGVLTGSGTYSYNSASDLALDVSLSGSANVVKAGTGRLTVIDVNSTGSVAINAGTLETLGAAFQSSAVTVNSGATLLGGANFSGDVTVMGGGTLHQIVNEGDFSFSGSLTLNSGSILNLELSAAEATSGRLWLDSGTTLTGSLAPGGITLNFFDAGDFAPGTYLIFEFAGASLNNFDLTDFALGTRPSGYTYNLALTGTALELTATTVVPEPATYAVIVGAVALGIVAYRRRRTAVHVVAKL